MGTTSWRHAGLSLVLDDFGLEQRRATADSYRRIFPRWSPDQPDSRAESTSFKAVTTRNK
jgi:hypothetical protein